MRSLVTYFTPIADFFSCVVIFTFVRVRACCPLVVIARFYAKAEERVHFYNMTNLFTSLDEVCVIWKKDRLYGHIRYPPQLLLSI